MPNSESAAVPSIAVDGPLRAGEVFQVLFTGRLRTLRGGYMWLRTLDGSDVALMRSDGNSEIPVGYTTDPTEFEMLADGISGDTSNFVLPASLEPGHYELCTANSEPEACTEVEVRPG